MKRTCFVIHQLLWFVFLISLVWAEEIPLKKASDLFKAGDFEEAGAAYQEVLKSHPKNVEALAAFGRLALLSNRASEAASLLERARQLDPANTQAKEDLAEALYRLDRFVESAGLLDSAASESRIRKLKSFAAQKPYDLVSESGTTTVPFTNTDPLPAVQVRINEKEPVHFLIDTGGSEIIIDTEYARQVDAALFGKETSTFAGGKKAEYEHGRVDSITIGDFHLRNIPVRIMPTQAFSAAAGGKRVDGIIGTIFLYHFCATLDYPAERLILRRPSMCPSDRSDTKVASIPFWLAGDHLILARGKVNVVPALLLVDTGLAGYAFTAPESMLKEAGVDLSRNETEGIGGGGKVKIVPFTLDELSLGEVRQGNVSSLAGPFPSILEYKFGFRIGGLVSHAFFREYAVTFDFVRMRLELERAKSYK